jgi:hypothetical protein
MSDPVITSVPSASADKAQFWAETIAAVTTSGLPVRAFCRARG